MPMPTKRARTCTVDMLPTANKLSASGSRTDVKKVSLFEQKRLRGFWPCVSESAGQQILAVSPQVLSVLKVTAFSGEIHSLSVIFAVESWRQRNTVAKIRILFSVYFMYMCNSVISMQVNKSV